MDIISFSDARANFKRAIDDVCINQAPMIIKRTHGSDAVLMSLDEYDGLQETLYLLSNPFNADKLMSSIAEFKAGKAQIRSLPVEHSEKENG